VTAVELVASADCVKEGTSRSVEDSVSWAVVVSDNSSIVVVPLMGTGINISI
jgi:hypothetical protein